MTKRKRRPRRRKKQEVAPPTNENSDAKPVRYASILNPTTGQMEVIEVPAE